VKRALLCLFLVAATWSCRGVERQHFQRLDEAGQAIEASIRERVDLPRYRPLLETFSAALSDTRIHVQTSRERALLAQYEAAYLGLNDMLLVWEAREARGSEMLPIREELPARIAREYELGVNTNEPPSIYASEALQTISTASRDKLAAAHRSLDGP